MNFRLTFTEISDPILAGDFSRFPAIFANGVKISGGTGKDSQNVFLPSPGKGGIETK